MVTGAGRHQVLEPRSPAAIGPCHPAPGQAARAVAAALLTGSGLGILLAYAGYQGPGFFTLIVAYIVGLVVGRVTLRFSGYYRSNSTGWIAASGAAWSYICAAIVIAAHVGGNPRLYVQVLGLLLAGFIAYRETS